ncbi:hypothetical protein VULLAG_LOCUS19558 [Vulpes lagopus]
MLQGRARAVRAEALSRSLSGAAWVWPGLAAASCPPPPLGTEEVPSSRPAAVAPPERPDRPRRAMPAG